MSRAHHRRQSRQQQQRHDRGGRSPRHQRGRREEPDLLIHIRRALREDHPLGLLAQASQYLEIFTPRPLDDVTGREHPIHRDEFIRSFQEIDQVETAALLHAIALLVSDERTREEIRGELDRRTHHLPSWVGELDQASITEVAEMTHILRDGDNVFVGVRWPSGQEMTALVYIDHNLGTVVKDAFPIPDGIDLVCSQFEEAAADPGVTIADLDPATARARIFDAIEVGDHFLPPFESETWPQCRAIVEWMARMLPAGGTGYVRPEWSEQERTRLEHRFFASPFAAGLESETIHRDLVGHLLWFGCDYGPGDPLRWSPGSVEIVLTDWFPRKIAAPAAELRRLPDVLRAFIRFAHAERGIPPELTEETLEAVDLRQSEFQAAIRDSRRPMGPWALAEATRAFLGFDDPSHGEYMLDVLAGQVGGHEQLDRLDAAVIPDEPFDWTGIPEDIQERVAEVLEWTDRCCDELLDVEYRTIVRRLLARAAAGDPAVFRRKARTDYAAAALVWAVGRASGLFRHMTVKSLMEWFGIFHGSASQRAGTLLRAAGIRSADDRYAYRPDLGDPGLLHSTKRKQLIELRDRYRQG